jgi:hypothetical protein
MGKKTALNTRYTLRRLRSSASTKHQSGYALCGVLFRHIFAVAGTLRVPLSQLQKRRIALSVKRNFFKTGR